MNATRRPRSLLPALLAAVFVLGACGGESDGPQTESPATSTPTSTPTPAPSVGSTEDNVEGLREIGTFSAAGLRRVEDGSVTPLDGADGVADWLAPYGPAPETVDEVTDAVETADVAEDETLLGLVLHTGCLAPQSWALQDEEGEFVVRVVPDDKEAMIDCIAAVTTLAVVAVPNGS